MLPSMGAPNSFVAAARTGSFSRAGADVGLTQSAISRQIALLEDWLQVPLFERIGRRVRITAEGRGYAAEIEPALDRIRRATVRLIDRPPENELTIATLPSFGMRWLAPRLPRLTAEHPELVVNFAARSFPFDFTDAGFDAAVHFGRPDWPGAVHDFLFREIAMPVCAPDWLAANPLASATDLIGKALLFQSSRRGAWARWFAEAGIAGQEAVSGPNFEQFLMLAQAAAAGSGIALIPTFLIEPELASGALVCPIDIPLATDEAYYLVSPAEGPPSAPLQAFRDWIKREAAG